ncbi:outer membrane protein OmpK [Celerinatantimonas sp. YJH-8]
MSFAAESTPSEKKDIHAKDYRWMQFNLMYAVNELPYRGDGHNTHDYLEMEFGGRSGVVDLYGYLDIFNLRNSKDSDKYGSPRQFLKFAPRFSLNDLTGKDLSFGPVKEVYIATLTNANGGNAADKGTDTYETQVGFGVDLTVPGLDRSSLNLYKRYVWTDHEWNGYQVSGNWGKSLYTFDNGMTLQYGGYLDYLFSAKHGNSAVNVSNGGDLYNGLFLVKDHWSIGYGLKLFKTIYGLKNGGLAGRSTGAGHYFSITYKM